jgi:hypothetical protein
LKKEGRIRRLADEAGYDTNGKRFKRYKPIKIEDQALLKTPCAIEICCHSGADYLLMLPIASIAKLNLLVCRYVSLTLGDHLRVHKMQ